ncbi:TniQ family protein [Streptomyces canus]|uniref:TniQ family protein n=1 Tax=Streptomyces canus TaxID=58343 RepID=UPI00099EE48A
MAVQQWHKGAWFHRSQARWCTMCLRSNDSRWLLPWKLPWSFACVDHAVYMWSLRQLEVAGQGAGVTLLRGVRAGRGRQSAA